MRLLGWLLGIRSKKLDDGGMLLTLPRWMNDEQRQHALDAAVAEVKVKCGVDLHVEKGWRTYRITPEFGLSREAKDALMKLRTAR